MPNDTREGGTDAGPARTMAKRRVFRAFDAVKTTAHRGGLVRPGDLSETGCMGPRTRVAPLLFAMATVGTFVGESACGGKIAPTEEKDAGLSGTCGGHQSKRSGAAPTCTTTDEVTCSSGTYVVACDCRSAQCVCAQNGAVAFGAPFPGCTCEPSREDLLKIYAACGFPY